jgi:hypothetical protein
MEVVKPQKGTTWTGILTGMEIGQELPASIDDRNTVAPLISRQLKYSHPGMKWRTAKSGEDTLTIIRVA